MCVLAWVLVLPLSDGPDKLENIESNERSRKLLSMDYGESLSEKAYRILKKDIVTCQLLPGERLSQAILSNRMEIGVTPIREALQRLAIEGFVEPIPRHGYLVTNIDVIYLVEVFEMRQILEQAAVRLAVERGRDKDINNIRDKSNFQYKYKDQNSYGDFLEKNIEFHLSIAEATGNRRLMKAISKLLVEMTRVFYLGLDLRDSGEEMRIEHIELADSLLTRDKKLAVKLVKLQIETSLGRIVEALNRKMSGGIQPIFQDILHSQILHDKEE
jgi:DNA-binding GntR family transcriptional regulator